MSTRDADLLIAGAGLAGLSLAVALATAGATADRRVLIVDPRPNLAAFPRDRTWCYWDVDPAPHPFAACVSKRWPRWRVADGGAGVERSAAGLSYCHIAGDAFYAAALERLGRDPNVELLLGRSVRSLDDSADGVTATLDDGSTLRASHAFDSRPPAATATKVAADQRSAVFAPTDADCGPLVKSCPVEAGGLEQSDPRLAAPLAGRGIAETRPASGAAKRGDLSESHPFSRVPDVRFSQQFVGHFVRTGRPAFDPDSVTLMDFRVEPVAGAIRFVYVLPFDEKTALVEATTIAEAPVPDAAHAAVIGEYLRRVVGVENWQVTGAERGAIPMTTVPRRVAVSPRVWRIGLAGGLAKPSTGYAFLAVQRFSRSAAESIARHEVDDRPLPAPPAVRAGVATALDRVFLARLRRRPDLAPALFARLFAAADPAALVRFLSDRATPADVARVIAALPKLPFAAEAARSWRLWARRTPHDKMPPQVAGSGSPGLRPDTSPTPTDFLASHTGASAPGY